MKANETLNVNDIISNKAEIYFDYNFPVETNEANTVFQTLSNTSFEAGNNVLVYPNPAESLLNVHSKEIVEKIELYDVQGRLVLIKIINQEQFSVDVSNLSRGTYLLKSITHNKQEVQKILLK